MNPRKAATLVATLVEYAVKNVNLAIDVLDLQREEFDDDDEFFDGVMNHSAAETDEFIVDMATSEPYLPSTIEALHEKGYKVIDESDSSGPSSDLPECCPEELVKGLIRLVGKKRAVLLIMDQE